MADVNALYTELSSHIGELAKKFVDPYIPASPSAVPSDYALDVRAYCVLSHAAFEEFVEAVVLTVASGAVQDWMVKRKATDVIISLIAWNGAKLKIDDDEASAETKPFDYLRSLVNEAKAAFSREVNKNQGISILHLRNLLIPVAIDIKSDPNLLNSLQKLAEGRGAYAHKGRVTTVLAPEDAKRYVQDVLALCDDIRVKALAAHG
jgi:hypothetical protein